MIATPEATQPPISGPFFLSYRFHLIVDGVLPALDDGGMKPPTGFEPYLSVHNPDLTPLWAACNIEDRSGLSCQPNWCEPSHAAYFYRITFLSCRRSARVTCLGGNPERIRRADSIADKAQFSSARHFYFGLKGLLETPESLSYGVQFPFII